MSLRSDQGVISAYLDAGAEVGHAVSYVAIVGEPHGFPRMVRRWVRWEAEYIRRGFRSIGIDEFQKYGGYGYAIKSIGIRREAGEKTVYHAQEFQSNWKD